MEDLDPASESQPSEPLPGEESVLEELTDEETRVSPFPVVGIGASAGGLEAFRQVLEHLPAETGMAYVFVQHLSPQHSSLLAPILGRATSMPVAEALQKTKVRPNRVYVIPPNTLMRITDSVLELQARPDERGAPRPIDYFFRSLAEDRQSQAREPTPTARSVSRPFAKKAASRSSRIRLPPKVRKCPGRPSPRELSTSF
jgi:two-component system CheB/CheR fusion protein